MQATEASQHHERNRIAVIPRDRAAFLCPAAVLRRLLCSQPVRMNILDVEGNQAGVGTIEVTVDDTAKNPLQTASLEVTCKLCGSSSG